MIKVEGLVSYNLDEAIEGMRNPHNSWENSDSEWESSNFCDATFVVGDNDLQLMQDLYQAGAPHRKYARQVFVSMHVTAPLYWWKEMETYKVGVDMDSCSTMHSIHKKPFELDDFSWEQLLDVGCDLFTQEFGKGSFARKIQPLQLLTDFIIPSLNVCREKYLETKDKKYWWQMIQLLPISYNQKRTVTMNYEVVFNILSQRSYHKLDEWRVFCENLKTLPYIKDIIL